MRHLKVKTIAFFCLSNLNIYLQGVPDMKVEQSMVKEQVLVHKKVLENGLTVLVRPVHTLPKVSMQIWYHVGSKDEKTGEKGIAHLIEHMIFKGTKTLSESDINVMTHMLSGSTNAFTSYDYTGYLFNMPVEHWKEMLPVMADCMQNVSFKDDHLNSEMKAVIQELKMNRDNYQRSLVMELISTMFADHPYHYQVIGFKQDLWNVHGDDLRAFYKKHYVPNNATLIIVGDVGVEDAFKAAEKNFAKIPANPAYKKEEFFHNNDLISHQIVLRRDIQQPFVLLAWQLPGAEEKNEHLLDVLSLILGSGKGSRLYKKLVDDLHLATSLSTFTLKLFEYSVFMIAFEPKDMKDVAEIEEIIAAELESILKNGLTDLEVQRAVKQAEMEYYGLLENIESQAYEIGKSYLATGDEQFAFQFLNKPKKEIEKDIKTLLSQYMRPSIMSKGTLLPLSDEDKKRWNVLQKESDEMDKEFLSLRGRTTSIEEASYAKKIKPHDAGKFDFPKPKTVTLKNGLKVFYFNNDATAKIDVVVDLKAQGYYDSSELPGLYNFVTSMLSEGTKKYTAAQLAEQLESRGMRLSVQPGSISMSMLSADLAEGLSLLEEVIEHPRFDEKEIEKVREQLLVEIKNFWDEPKEFAGQLIKEQIYKGHPYSKNLIGTPESISKITKKDLIEFHKKHFSPSGARMALVGDISAYGLADVLEKTIGKWQGPEVSAIEFPSLAQIKPCELVHPANRDQATLCFAGLSVDRKNPDYDKLLLFDQIFGGGALGSLHSKLFQLREQSGLFYSIFGSLTAASGEQPGMVIVKTMVSLDRLDEAEKAIKDTISTAVDTITEPEFKEARHAIVHSMVNNFASNRKIANVFLFLDRFGFPADYFDTRAEKLSHITLKEMQEAVRRVLRNESMFTLKVGRMEKKAK